MKYALLILFSILNFARPLNGQFIHRFNNLVGEQNVWNSANCIKTTIDGGYILGGSRWDGTASSSYLIKTDSLGNSVWIKEHIGSSRSTIFDIIQTADLGFVYTGTANNVCGINEPQVVKTDSTGNIQWAYTFVNCGPNNNTYAGGLRIVEAYDSYYVLGVYDDCPGIEGILLLRLDYSGNLMNWNTLLIPSTDVYGGNSSFSLELMSNGYFLATIRWLNQSSIILTFDATCQVTSNFRVKDPAAIYSEPIVVSEARNGNINLVSTTTDSIGIRRLVFTQINPAGILQNSKQYQFPSYDFIYAVGNPTANFELIISGCLRDTAFLSNSYHPFAMLIDSMGEIKHTAIYLEIAGEIRGATIAQDGGFAFSGVCYDSSARSFILKTDSHLKNSCVSNELDVDLNQNAMQVTSGLACSSAPIPRSVFGTLCLSHPPETYSLCSDSISILVPPKVDHAIEGFYVPNTFTPNADGLNDVFSAVIPSYAQNYHMLIFNRWGQMVFATNDINSGWDGTFKSSQCRQDVYVWKITFHNPYDSKEVKVIGTVTVL